MNSIEKEKLPRHIAVIMDGNGRWARQRLLNRISGHKKGIEAAREVVSCCSELGVECLTLYTFSRENWKRPAHEVSTLMIFLERHLKAEAPTLQEKNIRLKAIGNLSELPQSVQKVVREVENATASNTGMLLQLALSYSGREELATAARTVAEKAASGELAPEDVNEQTFEGFLYTTGVPDPDLLIRTSGERRISNFLLWQLAYTELYITEVLWPDFTREHLFEAIRDYQSRERRFGKVKEHEAVVN